MIDEVDLRRFELLALPHLDAAYNLARWLTRNDQDAQDVVQGALLRAMRYFYSFRADNARPWLLQIVRHTCFSWLKENRPAELMALEEGSEVDHEFAAPESDAPEGVAIRNADRSRINLALAALPIIYRDVLILREMEDLSYKEIARIADVPIGTVMSRVARARDLMRRALAPAAPPVLSSVGQSASSGVEQ